MAYYSSYEFWYHREILKCTYYRVLPVRANHVTTKKCRDLQARVELAISMYGKINLKHYLYNNSIEE